MEKILVGEILSNSAVVDRIRPKLTIPQQIEYMRDKKGIKFNIISYHIRRFRCGIFKGEQLLF